jgi:hypothetical protein
VAVAVEAAEARVRARRRANGVPALCPEFRASARFRQSPWAARISPRARPGGQSRIGRFGRLNCPVLGLRNRHAPIPLGSVARRRCPASGLRCRDDSRYRCRVCRRPRLAPCACPPSPGPSCLPGRSRPRARDRQLMRPNRDHLTAGKSQRDRQPPPGVGSIGPQFLSRGWQRQVDVVRNALLHADARSTRGLRPTRKIVAGVGATRPRRGPATGRSPGPSVATTRSGIHWRQ